MKRNLDLFHPCGWHLHPSGWRDGVTSYAEWADKVVAMWPTFEHDDMDTVLCVRCIAKLQRGHIPPLSEREMFDDPESLAQLKDALGCKLMVYEGAEQKGPFNFQAEWGVWSRVVSLAQPDWLVFDAITTAEQAKFYGDLGKNLNVPVLFEPYHRPTLSQVEASGAFQLDGYGRNGDWNWDVCLSRMAREVAGYDRDSLARLWYLWISMPWNQRDNTEVNAMTQKAITEALAVGIRNIGLNLNHVKPGAFLEPTLRWLEELQLPI